jgi:fructoselysine-6-P-deglycase FrlB-like protein
MTQAVDIAKVNAEGIEIERVEILERMGQEIALAGPAAEAAWPAIRAAASALPKRAYHAVVLTGCGDSYYAALALRGLVEAASGVPVHAIPAMEAVTNPTLQADDRALLVGISVSGKVERTIEAVTNHRARGGTTAAISAFADSDVAAITIEDVRVI